MIPIQAKRLSHISFVGLYGWLGYLTAVQENMPGFFKGIVHGIFWLARLVLEMWMDFSIFVNPHSRGYIVAFIIGIPLAVFGYVLYFNTLLILLRWIPGARKY